MTGIAISPTTANVPGPKSQDLEEILARFHPGTRARIKRALGPDAPKGAQAEFIREAVERELKRRERKP